MFKKNIEKEVCAMRGMGNIGRSGGGYARYAERTGNGYARHIDRSRGQA